MEIYFLTYFEDNLDKKPIFKINTVADELWNLVRKYHYLVLNFT